MKKIIFYLLITTGLYAQTVYEVVPGTKGNEVVLSIVNESQTVGAEKVTVVLANNPKGIETINKFVEIEKLKKGEEKETLFSESIRIFEASRLNSGR